MTAILLALLMVLSIIPVTVLSAAADDASTATFTVYAVELNDLYKGLPIALSTSGEQLDSGKKLSEILPNVITLRASSAKTNPFLIFALENNGEVIGDYTLPKYTSILVPNDEANTYYSVTPGDVTMPDMVSKGLVPAKASGQSEEEWLAYAMYTLLGNTVAFKTLTVSGKITFSAMSQMSVGAYYYAGDVRDSSLYNAGMPSNAILGPYGLVTLSSGAELNFTNAGITDTDVDALTLPDIEDSKPVVKMEKGSYLFAWGFINGAGTVKIQDGANVYEDFQLSDFPDMETAMQMMERDSERQLSGVFPVSQYYVQNIEANMNIYAGGTEKIHACLALGTKKVPIEVPFAGGEDSGSMFIVKGGYVTKYFEPSPLFKTKFIINGEAEIANLSMNLAGLADISSSDFQLPITNIDIVVTEESSLAVTQDIQLLPYASITVAEDAVLDVQSTIYVVDAPKEGDDRTYPGVRDVMLLSTSEGLGLDPTHPEAPFTNVKQVTDDSGAQLIVDGTVTIQNMGEDSPAGIAYVGDEAISGTGSIINYSPYEVPPMNIMSSGAPTTEEAVLEAVIVYDYDQDEYVVYTADEDNPVGYKYSEDYDVWYLEGEDINIVFKDCIIYDDEGNPIGEPDVIDEGVYEFGEDINFPDDPEKEGDHIYTSYEFKRWKASNPAAMKDGAPATKAIASTVFYAEYEFGDLREYDTTFKDTDGTILQATQTKPYGSHVEFTGTAPSPSATQDWKNRWDAYDPATDVYLGWFANPLSSYTVTQDVVFKPHYVDKQFTVSWLDHTGSVSSTTKDTTTEYGKAVESNYIINSGINYNDAKYYNYTVSGWSYEGYDVVNKTAVSGTVEGATAEITVYGDTACTPIFTAEAMSGGEDPFICESLTLNGDIDVNFLIQLPAGYSADDCKVEFSWGGETYTDSELTAAGSTDYGTTAVASVEIAPKQMMDTITATLKKGNAEIASTTYHAADYAVRVLTDPAVATYLSTNKGYSNRKIQKLKDLCESLLWYSLKAQTQLNYTATDAKLVSDVSALVANYEPLDPHEITLYPSDVIDFTAYCLDGYVGSTMQLNSETTYSIFFRVTDVERASAVTATAFINDKEYDTEAYLVEDTNGVQNAFLRVDIKDIPAKEITDVITVTFNETTTFYVSSKAYIKSALTYGDATLIDTVTAIYTYNQKAIAYFEEA